jgi:hypothetical protein
MDDQPATIHSLPPELLADCLSHLFTTDFIDLDSLKSASLVSSTFRHPAQRLVWAAGAEVRSGDDVERFIASSGRRRGGPREVAIHGYKDAAQLKRLFEVCGGLRWLMIATPDRALDATALASAQLSSAFFLSSLFPPVSRSSLPFPQI